MSLLLDIADVICNLPIEAEERDCTECRFLEEEGGCKLWSIMCRNHPCRPYYEPIVVVQQQVRA